MALFRKTESTSTPTPTSSGTSRPTGAGTAAGKGHPTPKRKVAQAQRQRPLVPGDRKAAKQAARVRSREARDREFEAMKTGDEKHLPLRDKGPVKRWIRDYVDARWNLAEFFLPIAIVFVVVTTALKNNLQAAAIALVILYLIVLITIIEAFVSSRLMRRKLIAKFGPAGVAKGNIMYGAMRSFQIRRSRLPKPLVKRGEHPS